jgi:2',3'-cyclic-nucleotide 2'-phosphodiesterase (5'-nucleotidase family)
MLPLLALLFLGACAGEMKIKRRESNAEVMLISFGGTNGELKDCGCHANPRGGLPHREALVDSLRARNVEFALVDLGDFANSETIVGEMKTRFIWEKMEEMGYTASTPGTRELSAWNLYRDLVSKGKIQSVATNLKVVSGGTDAAAGLPFYIETIGGVRVAFFSLISQSVVSLASPTPGVEFRADDPLTTAKMIIPRLRKEADLIVLMSQLPATDTDDLIRKVPGVDVALYGRQPMYIDRVQKIDGTLTQQTGIRGMYLGELILIVDPDGRIVDSGSRNDGLGVAFGEKEEVTAQIQQIEDQAKEMIEARPANANPGQASPPGQDFDPASTK